MGFLFLGTRKTGKPSMESPFDIAADLDTPVSAYMKLKPFKPRFLLESVESGERLARYSFIGLGEAVTVELHSDRLLIDGKAARRPTNAAEWQTMMRTALERAPLLKPQIEGIPFDGGLVGTTGYDVVRFFERLPPNRAERDGPKLIAAVKPASGAVASHSIRVSQRYLRPRPIERQWSEMRAGRFASTDSVVCTDGQRAAASKRACTGHGGVDSVSTLAAVRNRAKANRQAQVQRATSEAAGDSSGTDSTKWGYQVDRNPDAQNPPGYRGMERPASLDSARATDSVVTDTAATDASAMDTTGQSRDTSMAGRADSTRDMIHRQRSVPPGTAAPPPPYTPDSEKVWVQERPSNDSVDVNDSGAARPDSGR